MCNHITIPLSSRKYPGLTTIIDESDYHLVEGRKIGVLKHRSGKSVRYSAAFRLGGKYTLLHRLIMGVHGSSSPDVDHIDRNSLNNCRHCNLRVATRTQNNGNCKGKGINGYKGVKYESRNAVMRWTARITKEGKHKYLGGYETIEEAARAYDEAAREMYGEFARLNFPDATERGAVMT